jgi:thymidylate synthase (FAD)
MEFVIPPWCEVAPDSSTAVNFATEVWVQAMENAEAQYCGLLANGWKPEQARSVLPNSLKTEVVMTANMREWKHIFHMRTSSAAHPQMRELMSPLQEEMRKLLPEIFE